MTDPLLRYFEQELAFVRRSLGQFGSDYPTHAESLNIHQGKVEDPSMARLLDGVALLNANLEKQLSDQLPEVVEGLLDVLYPSYVQTVPSVAYLHLNDDEPITEAVSLPKGSQFVGLAKGEECIFTTVDKIEVSPFSIVDIQALSAPFSFNRPQNAARTSAVIQISLSTGDPEVFFSQLDIGDFDFFVQGFENSADSLVELLLSNVSAISLSDSTCESHRAIESNNLKNRISDLEFKFLPQHGNQFSGYQLLNEYFFFKEKRQFFRLKRFGDFAKQFSESEIIVNLFMDSLPSEFVRLFDKGVFKLNVVPAVNLFEQTGEPINYDNRKLSAPINADAHSDSTINVVEVKEVYEITSQGEKKLTPLFRDKYGQGSSTDYWQCKRDHGDTLQLSVSLSDPNNIDFNKLYGTRLLCTNGKQACAAEGEFECIESIDLPAAFSAIYPPSAPIERERDQHMHWQFVGLLNCNFSSLLQSPEPENELKQMLALCSRSQVSSSEIQMIRSVNFRSQVSAIRIMGKNVFSPGTEIEITLDAKGAYHVFSDVLNRFFQQFCSFDRYVRLSVRVYGRDGIAKQYPKVHGSQLCL
ncbi:type VI secretion system baseplate subunit TssF [Vibrio paucivorans]